MITYIGECCREWILAFGYPTGKCGLCGEVPKHVRIGPVIDTDALIGE